MSLTKKDEGNRFDLTNKQAVVEQLLAQADRSKRASLLYLASIGLIASLLIAYAYFIVDALNSRVDREIEGLVDDMRRGYQQLVDETENTESFRTSLLDLASSLAVALSDPHDFNFVELPNYIDSIDGLRLIQDWDFGNDNMSRFTVFSVNSEIFFADTPDLQWKAPEMPWYGYDQKAYPVNLSSNNRGKILVYSAEMSAFFRADSIESDWSKLDVPKKLNDLVSDAAKQSDIFQMHDNSIVVISEEQKKVVELKNGAWKVIPIKTDADILSSDAIKGNDDNIVAILTTESVIFLNTTNEKINKYSLPIEIGSRPESASLTLQGPQHGLLILQPFSKGLNVFTDRKSVV